MVPSAPLRPRLGWRSSSSSRLRSDLFLLAAEVPGLDGGDLIGQWSTPSPFSPVRARSSGDGVVDEMFKLSRPIQRGTGTTRAGRLERPRHISVRCSGVFRSGRFDVSICSSLRRMGLPRHWRVRARPGSDCVVGLPRQGGTGISRRRKMSALRRRQSCKDLVVMRHRPLNRAPRRLCR